MTKKQTERLKFWRRRMLALDISIEDQYALRRISMTLDRWHEQECGDSNEHASWAIERGENGDGPPFMVVHSHSTGKIQRYRMPDREKSAMKRLATIMRRYPRLEAYIQGDPRGGALYLVPRDKIGTPGTSAGIDCVYSSHGAYCNYD